MRLIRSDRLQPETGIPLHLLYSIVRGRIGRWMPRYGVSNQRFEKLVRANRLGQRMLFVDGYFQDTWMPRHLDEAVGMVRVIEPAQLRHPIELFDCLVHIRGGDFLQYATHRFVDDRYYVHAIGVAKQHGKTCFAVLSDDASYARQIIKSVIAVHRDITIVLLPATSDALDDFHALRFAPARVIGNSTFAWWAAALGNRESVTWAPNQFVRDRKRGFFLQSEHVLDDWAI